MANPENVGPHRFKKGKSGNPNGRPKEPEELKFYRKNARNGYTTYLMKMLCTKLRDLEKEKNKPELLAYEAMALKLIHKSVKDGAPRHMELLMKLLKIDLDNKHRVEIKDVSDKTGLEKIPTHKLEAIQDILTNDSND